jgi:sarcosine oxidase
MSVYDVGIIGLGAMGSAAAYHCARRGALVIGFDRFAPPHALGSSHGESRIIREAYFENPRYVPLVQRAYRLWHELEARTGQTLLRETGGLMIGPADGVLVRGARESAEIHGLPYRMLDAREIRARFPSLAPRDDMVGVWEPRAGVLFPERCVRAHLEEARASGVELRMDEPVSRWSATDGGFTIETPRGHERARRLVLATNAWLERLLPGVTLPLTVARQPLFWFEPAAHAERLAELPIHLWEPEPDRFFYGFPAIDGRIKVATHGLGVTTDPDTVDRTVRDDEVEAMRARLATYLPDANGRFDRAAVCLYANTPDGHFVIDRHPDHADVLVLSVCSGHGFKFSPAIGDLAADLLLEGATDFDLEPFRLARFG